MLGWTCVAALLAASPDPRITPRAVDASSARTGAPVEHLVDGEPATAWQPDAAGAFGLGQWVRLDFGREVEVTRLVIHNGVQRVDGGVDRFCADARAASLGVYGDRGGRRHVERGDDGRSFTFELGDMFTREPLRTRALLVVIDGIEAGFERQGEVGLSEIEVHGRDAATPSAPEAGDVTCGSARLGALRRALIERCAARYAESRPLGECTKLRSALDSCGEAKPRWLPIPAATFDAGRIELAFTSRDPPFVALAATFVREGERWRADAATCKRGKAMCGESHTLDADGDRDDGEVWRKALCRASDGSFIKRP